MVVADTKVGKEQGRCYFAIVTLKISGHILRGIGIFYTHRITECSEGTHKVSEVNSPYRNPQPNLDVFSIMLWPTELNLCKIKYFGAILWLELLKFELGRKKRRDLKCAS